MDTSTKQFVLKVEASPLANSSAILSEKVSFSVALPEIRSQLRAMAP
jgi:hypothetical protein